jgi:hypothetical protein
MVAAAGRGEFAMPLVALSAWKGREDHLITQLAAGVTLAVVELALTHETQCVLGKPQGARVAHF